MKKTFALLLVLVFSLALLPAFASEYADPIEITWMIPTQQSISLGESVPTKKLLEKFNLTVNWIELAPNDQHPEKLGLLLAAQELPDIVTWVSHSDAVQYGEEGAYLEITPYLDSHFPNLKAVLEKESASHYAVYSLDEKLWYVPGWSRSVSPNWGYSINKAAFEEVGYTIDDIKTFADFKAALAALKEAHPESFPLTFRGAEVPYSELLNSFLIPFTRNKGTSGVMGFDYDTKEYKLSAAMEGYKEAFMYLHELYAEGLLHPEFLTLSMDDLTMQIAEGGAFAVTDYVGGLSGVASFQEQVGNCLYPIVWPSPDDKPVVMGSKPIALIARGTVFPSTIVEDEEKFARVAAMIDYMYSDEFYDLFYNNPDVIDPEGDGQKYVDAYYKREDNLRDLYFPWSMEASFQDDTVRYDVEPGTPWADFVVAYSNEYVNDLTEPVILPMDTETQAEVNEIADEVRDYWNNNILQFVVGQSDFEDWDAFVAEMYRLGGTELEGIYNSVYQEIYG